MEIKGRIDTIQATVLLRSIRILIKESEKRDIST